MVVKEYKASSQSLPILVIQMAKQLNCKILFEAYPTAYGCVVQTLAAEDLFSSSVSNHMISKFRHCEGAALTTTRSSNPHATWP